MSVNKAAEGDRRVSEFTSECSTLLVGKQMTDDGSFIVSRSEDWDAMIAKRFEKHPNQPGGWGEFIALDSPFRCSLPKGALGYTALPSFDLPGHWGSAGFNEVGVGMSATESIFSNDMALAVDPLIPEGVGENSVFNIVLPYVKSAREAVLRTGALIQEHGTSEGFAVGYVDHKEIWYLETACGHRWMAARIPEDVYFVSGNQSRLREFNPDDKNNFLGSEDLISFAIQHKLYDPSAGAFDFHEVYARDVKLDTTYNYPRVWGIQAMLSPMIKSDVEINDFPVYAKARKKITLRDVMEVFRFHYQGTAHDPYLHSNPNEPYRPVSIFRTTQTHILHVRPELPIEIGEVNYVSLGMAALGVFIPFYHGMSYYLESYNKGKDVADSDSAYWKFRKVQTLAMIDFNKYAPIVQQAYSEFEDEVFKNQKEMEREYLSVYVDDPLKGKIMIQAFEDKVMQEALILADHLINQLFTLLTKDIQNKYKFSGA